MTTFGVTGKLQRASCWCRWIAPVLGLILVALGPAALGQEALASGTGTIGSLRSSSIITSTKTQQPRLKKATVPPRSGAKLKTPISKPATTTPNTPNALSKRAGASPKAAPIASTTTVQTDGIASPSAPPAVPVSELVVAGASDLRPAFEEIGKLFTAESGTKVTFSFGSSGQLAQQIENGAPFDVFASADANYVDQIIKAGEGEAATKATYAFGRLALWIPARTQKRVFNVVDLADPSFQRIAIANPEHAPYGAAAQQTLQTAKIFELIRDRIVFGENVSDTYRIATSGNADAALVSLSLVIANSNGGKYLVVPSDMHKALEQTIVVTATKPRSTSAKAFLNKVTSPAGRAIMRKFGFLLPGDPKPLDNNG
jgi:molybdate transport system substrate-binding protein